MPDVLVFLYTYDRAEVLRDSLRSMFADPGMPFRLWVVDNGSAFSDLYGPQSGRIQHELLLRYYLDKKIELLLLNDRNLGINHAINQVMALAKLHSDDPRITPPEFVFQTNDDMRYEPGWLAECHRTLLDCESAPQGKSVIVSPFHCRHSTGTLAEGMATIGTHTVGGRTYEIKAAVSGNTWFMRCETWLSLFDWYPVNHPTEGGDWAKLALVRQQGYTCAVTPTEMAHHDTRATGQGRMNRLHHWA